MAETYEQYKARRAGVRGLIRDLGDKVAFRGPLGNSVVLTDVADYTMGCEEFREQFEFYGPGTTGKQHDQGEYLATSTSFYQGLDMVTVIQRKSDGRLFGFQYWHDISKHSDGPYFDENGDDHDLDSEDPLPQQVLDNWDEGEDGDTDWVGWYVFVPAEVTTVPAARLTEGR